MGIYRMGQRLGTWRTHDLLKILSPNSIFLLTYKHPSGKPVLLSYNYIFHQKSLHQAGTDYHLLWPQVTPLSWRLTISCIIWLLFQIETGQYPFFLWQTLMVAHHYTSVILTGHPNLGPLILDYRLFYSPYCRPAVPFLSKTVATITNKQAAFVAQKNPKFPFGSIHISGSYALTSPRAVQGHPLNTSCLGTSIITTGR